MTTESPIPQPLVLFDGVCHLCSGSVQFLLERDKKNAFYFTPLQSELGQKIKGRFGLFPQSLDSVMLLDHNQLYTKSEAALRCASYLGGIYQVMAAVFRVIPRGIRDAVYDWVARNRYGWFGKSDTCFLPKPEWKNRFLE